MFTAQFPQSSRWLLAGIVGMGAVAFVNVPGHDFIDWDDRPFLINNSYIHSFGPRALWTLFTTDIGVYRPVIYAIYALVRWLFGLDPFAYHLVSLLFHLGNVGLVFVIIGKLGFRPGVAAFTAMGFAVHPTRTESVAWVLALTDPVYSCFLLLSLYAYLVYLQTNGTPKYYLLSVLAFGISLLAKPSGVVWPVVLLLVDYQQRRPLAINRWIDKIPFLIGAGLFAYITLHLGANGKDYNVRPIYQWPDKLLLAAYSLFYYVKVMVWPVDLAFIYALPIKTAGRLPTAFYWAAVFPLSLLGGLYWLWRHDERNQLFAWAFFLVNLGLVLHLVSFNHSIVHDRYTYLPAIGFCLSVALLVDRWGQRRPKLVWVGWTALGLLGLAWAWGTHCYNRAWANAEVHYRTAIAHQPTAVPMAFNNLADELGRKGTGHPGERLALYNQAIAIYPILVQAHLGRAEVLLSQGQLTGADSAVQAALRLRPDHPRAYLYQGLLSAQRGDQPGALAALSRAVALDRQGYFPEIYLARARIYLALGQNQAACADFGVAARAGVVGAQIPPTHCQ